MNCALLLFCVSTDHITWWRHQMETSSALLALCAGNSPAPVNSPHKGQWGGALMFSLISAWTNGWVNNRDAGDLRRHRVHYDVTVMTLYFHILWLLHFFRLFWQIFWRNCRHWLYRNLSMPWFWNLCRNFSFWQLPVHPAVKLWLKWRQFICVVQLYYITFMW